MQKGLIVIESERTLYYLGKKFRHTLNVTFLCFLKRYFKKLSEILNLLQKIYNLSVTASL